MLLFSLYILLASALIAVVVFGATAGLHHKPACTSASTTALLLLAAISYQWRVGNIGATSGDVLCFEFCVTRGFTGSGVPPRNAGAPSCSCFDAQGREATKLPMAERTAPTRP